MQHKHMAEMKALKCEEEETLKQLDATMKALQLEKDNSSELEARLKLAEEELKAKGSDSTELVARLGAVEEELQACKKAHERAESEYRCQVG